MKDIYVYRKGTTEDYADLKALRYIAYSEYEHQLEPQEWDKLKSNLNNDTSLKILLETSVPFVALSGTKIVGVAYYIPRGNPTNIYEADWCYIRMIGVHPEHRGHGISKKLVLQCIDHARLLGEPFIMLHTSEMMDAARYIYEGLGFKIYKDIDKIFGKQYWLYKLDL